MSEPDPVLQRGQRQRERAQRAHAYNPPGIRVVPASEDMRRVLKHPTRGGFRAEGSIEWPDDGFTRKRLLEGSIKREEKTEPAKAGEPDKPAQHHR